MISLFLDIGNILFFIATLPQIVTAYRERRNLKAISKWMLLLFMSGTGFFITVNIICSAYIATGLGLATISTWLMQLYWKWRYR